MNYKIHITLLFSYGVSLRNWVELGLFDREVKLYQYLKKEFDLEVQFITYGDKSDKEYLKCLDGIKVLPLYERVKKPKNKLLVYLYSLCIPWIFKEELVETDLIKTNQIWGGWVAVLIKWFLKKPYIARCGYEKYLFSLKQRKSRLKLFIIFLISKIIYKNAKYINVATNSDKQFIKRQFKIDSYKINVIPNWIDTKIYKPLNIKAKNRILFVGRLEKQKNINLILKSLKHTKLGLDIIGQGSKKKELKDLAKKLNIDVQFLGKINNDKMPLLYNNYKIYVICSDFEGNPKTLLEAMSCSIPVIGTNVLGIREIIKNNENGILVSKDYIALKKAILKLYSDERLCKYISDNSRDFIIKKHSLNKIILDEYNCYKNFMD